jgi:hypothetical protein
MAGMPVSVNSITPSSGPTGGSLFVEIAGEGFQLPAPPAAAGPTTLTPPTVHVLVGGRLAEDVRVLGADRLTCILPAGDEGPADVVVQNVDLTGVSIPGEEATLSKGFTYFLHQLTTESDLTRIVRTLIRELKRQVLKNVVLTEQTDFDPDTGEEFHLAQLAELPGIVLSGPDLSEDRFYSINDLPEETTGVGTYLRRRVPYTVDLGFTLVGVSDHTAELLNLLASTQLFFHRNKFLVMLRDPAHPGSDTVRYEMDFTADGDLKVTGGPNESNVRSFSGKFVIRGFDLEDLAGVMDANVVERGSTVESVQLEETVSDNLIIDRNPA